MSTVTIPKIEYKTLVRRQARVERDLDILKKLVQSEIREEQILPSVLKRWERISRDLDRGKGRSFSSAKAMKKWLKDL